MTRSEHLAWAKRRAMDYVNAGDMPNALTSIGLDLDRHPETKGHPGTKIGLQLMMIGALNTKDDMKRFIEGFN